MVEREGRFGRRKSGRACAGCGVAADEGDQEVHVDARVRRC